MVMANVIFTFFLFNKFAKLKKILFSLCHYGVLSGRLMRGKKILKHFSIRLQHNKMWKRWRGLNTFWMHCTYTYTQAHTRYHHTLMVGSTCQWHISLLQVLSSLTKPGIFGCCMLFATYLLSALKLIQINSSCSTFLQLCWITEPV